MTATRYNDHFEPDEPNDDGSPPEWVHDDDYAALDTECERLRECVADLEQQVKDSANEALAFAIECQRLRDEAVVREARCARLEAALRFYADESNYADGVVGRVGDVQYIKDVWLWDQGSVARAALAATEPEQSHYQQLSDAVPPCPSTLMATSTPQAHQADEDCAPPRCPCCDASFFYGECRRCAYQPGDAVDLLPKGGV